MRRHEHLARDCHQVLHERRAASCDKLTWLESSNLSTLATKLLSMSIWPNCRQRGQAGSSRHLLAKEVRQMAPPSLNHTPWLWHCKQGQLLTENAQQLFMSEPQRVSCWLLLQCVNMMPGPHSRLTSRFALPLQGHLNAEQMQGISCLTSFSMTATRLPCCRVRMLFSRVVLPDPRKPVMTCTEHAAVRKQCLQRAAPAQLAGATCTVRMDVKWTRRVLPEDTLSEQPGPWLPQMAALILAVLPVAAAGSLTNKNKPTALQVVLQVTRMSTI